MSKHTPGPKSPAVGDIWHRVDGELIDDGSETYQGTELAWTTWRAVKVTPQGAWFACVERHWKKPRFALSLNARWLSRTREEALESLIARKRRHLAILSSQEMCARDTLEIALRLRKEQA